MGKIKIAMLMYSLECGGIEKAAVTLLRALPEKNYEIHLILNHKKGQFINLVPSYVKIQELEVSKEYTKRTSLGEKKWLYTSLAHRHIRPFINTLTCYFKGRFLPKERAWLLKTAQLSEEIKFPKDHFDYVLAFSNIEQLFHATNYYNTDHIITWLHNEIDIPRYDYRVFSNLFSKCDRIYGVSQKVVDSFIKYLPQFSNSTYTFPNLIDTKLGKDISKKYQIERPSRKWWLLTVGRLTEQKGIDIIPDIALRLKQLGVDFVWSIVGDGSLRSLLESKVKEYGLEPEINIIGEVDNPYPYFKACDIYLQPSRYEGYCITVAEARMFHKPIVATNFAGASEQLENGECGKIVEFGVDSFANGVLEVIKNSELRNKYIEGLSKQKIDTTDTISVLTDYMESNLKKS